MFGISACELKHTMSQHYMKIKLNTAHLVQSVKAHIESSPVKKKRRKKRGGGGK